MDRLPDWPARLTAFLSSRATLPFKYGQTDCVTFAADAILAVTGEDPLGDLRGKWKAKASALRLLAKHGGLLAAVQERMAHIGAWEIRPGFAQRGDIGIGSAGNELPALWVCTGRDWAAPGEERMMTRENAVSLAWAIGRTP